MKITIIGAGAMGCRFGVAFKEASQEVCLYDIWEEHINKIKENGLKVYSEEGTKIYNFNATSNIDEIGETDCFFIFTKSIHTESAMESIKALIRENTTVASLQNGLGNIEIINKYVDKNKILAGVTNYATDLLGPGEIEAKGSGITKIMNIEGYNSETLNSIVNYLNNSGINTEITEDVIKEIWQKVAFNAALNTMTALTRLRVADLGNTEESKELIEFIVSEINLLASKKGIPFDKEEVLSTINCMLAPEMSGEHITSMLQDFLKNNKTEIDTITGKIVEQAEKEGISLPYNKTIYSLIKIIEKNYQKQINSLK